MRGRVLTFLTVGTGSLVFYEGFGLAPALWIAGVLIAIYLLRFAARALRVPRATDAPERVVKKAVGAAEVAAAFATIVAIYISWLLLGMFGGRVAVAFTTLYLVSSLIWQDS